MTSPIISPDTPQLKTCTKCGEVKSLDAFFRDSTRYDGLRYQCKACIHEYRAANRENRREYMRKYNAENAEHIAEQRREYLAANVERIAERTRTYQRTEAGKAVRRAADHNRRARKAGNGGTFTAADLAAIRAAQTDAKGRLICWRCGKPIKDTPHLDHWQPLKHGGPNSAGNLHYMHWKCNLEKAAKLPAELGRLI